jgi:hypothetical protein
MKFAKNKLVLIGGAIVLIVLLVVSFLVFGKTKSTTQTQTTPTAEEQAITMKPEDIGLVLSASPGNKEVVMKISDLSKFSSFEYEMNYDAVVNGETVPRGAIGSGDVKSGDTSITRNITIGTCSSGKCKYDLGVKKVAFLIRLNLKTGKTAVVQKDLTLSE